MTNKWPGRVGDTPIIGAGAYQHNTKIYIYFLGMIMNQLNMNGWECYYSNRCYPSVTNLIILNVAVVNCLLVLPLLLLLL